jgi:membrane protease YdiL (CAAX protease family)
MTIIKALIKRHPVLAFYVLVFAISWGGILLVIGGHGAIPGTKEQVETLMPFALLALFAGPSVAGLVLIGLVHGRAGFRDLFTRMTRWRVGIRWYVVALLAAPLMVTTVLLALSLTSPEFLPRLLTAHDRATLLLFGIGAGLVGGGLLEELGWTGFAVPTLRQRYGVLGTGFIVGLFWGAWHYLIAFWTISGTTPGAISPSIFLPALIFYAGSLPAYRVLLVWVYDRTGDSMLLAMLMHASLSASMLTLEPLGLAAVPGSLWALVLAAAWWVVVGAVALAQGGHLSRGPLRRRAA